MSSSPLPPPPEQPSKSKPIWKQWWLWAIVVVLILIAAGAGIAATTQTEAEAGSPSPATSTTTTTTTPSPTPETAQVPVVVGKSVDVATSELEAAGFVVRVETKLTNAAHPGRVLQQSGTSSLGEVGDTITLTVAKALPKIPKVVGKTLANAKRALNNAGFEVGKVTQQTSSKKQGTVIAQSPDAGTSARPGRAVSLVTAKPAPQSPSNCTPGYSPCLPPASDYDCLGGTGDGPAFTGFVRVTGSDPYGLDSDGDGFGCE